MMSMKIEKNLYCKRFLLLSFVLVLFLGLASVASATTLFFDDFNGGPDVAWSNQYGSWTVTSGGSYISLSPKSSNPTYSSINTLPLLTDFALDIDVNNLQHGGIFLRSTSRDRGVALILRSNGTIYWHKRSGGRWGSKLGEVFGVAEMAPGEDVSLRIEVIGVTYSVYLNGASAAVTTLTDYAYTGGYVALYDYSDSMTFDNVRVSDFANPVPEPSTYLLLGSGLLGLVIWRRRARKNS